MVVIITKTSYSIDLNDQKSKSQPKFNPNNPYEVVNYTVAKNKKHFQAGDWKTDYLKNITSDKFLENKIFNLRGYYFHSIGDSYIFSRLELKSNHRENILCYFPPSTKLIINGKVKVGKIRNGSSFDKELGVKSYYCNLISNNKN